MGAEVQVQQIASTDSVVSADTNGDLAADFVLVVQGVSSLVESSFIL